MTVSPDGHAVYVAAHDGGVIVLVRPIVRVVSERARVRRRSVALRIRCFAERPGRCRGTLSLRRGRAERERRRGTTRLGHRRFSIPPGATKTVRVRLSARGRRRLTHRGHRGIRAVTRASDGIGHTHTAVAGLTLSAARRRR